MICKIIHSTYRHGIYVVTGLEVIGHQRWMKFDLVGVTVVSYIAISLECNTSYGLCNIGMNPQVPVLKTSGQSLQGDPWNFELSFSVNLRINKIQLM